MTETMTVLVVEPMNKPYPKEIPNTLKAMQELVGGYIEAVYPYSDSVAIVVNEEGKLIGLPPNRLLKSEDGIPYDILAGTFFVTGLSEDNFASLTEAQIQKYTEVFTGDMLLPTQKKRKEKNFER